MDAFKYKIIGTSHVAKEAKKLIIDGINELNPDTICIELDINRLQGLLTKKKASFKPSLIRQVGFGGYMFGLIGHLMQKKIGSKLKINAGADMLAAYKLAKKNNLKINLIDQDIQITLRKISKYFTFKERVKVVLDIIKGLLSSKKSKRKMIDEYGLSDLDLSKVPSAKIVDKMILGMKDKYPGLYRALVDDRNVIMANRVYGILKRNPLEKVLVVVGAGHKSEMEKIINEKLLKLEYLG